MPTPPASDLLDDLFETLFRLRPVDAAFIGRHEYDGALPAFDAAGIAAQRAEIDRLAAEFADDGREMTPAERLDWNVAQGYLDSQAALWRSDHAPHRDPSAITGLAVLGIVGLLRRDHAPAARRVASALQRIRGLPTLLAVAEGAAATAPDLWLETARPHLRAGIGLLRDGLPAFCAAHGLAAPDPDALAEGIRAFDGVAAALDRSTQHERISPACGRALMDTLLEKTHHIPGGCATVEAVAKAELAETHAALEMAARPFGKDWQAVIQDVQADIVPQSTVPARHREIFEAHKKLVEDLGLLTWPDYPLDYRTTPEWLSGLMGDAGAYPYHAAAPLDPDVPVDFIIPDAPGGTPEITILSNHVLHHAGVGHHVQNWYAYNRAETRFGRYAAVDSAGYIFVHAGIGMAEGWSGYVPGMIDDYGLYDARQKLALLHDRLRAACRGMVDVKLHGGDWSADDAVHFLVGASGSGEVAARAAVRRISHAASSGSMYLMGPALIRALRIAVAGADAPPGEVGLFHDRLLSYGSLPLPLIARDMAALSVHDLLPTAGA